MRAKVVTQGQGVWQQGKDRPLSDISMLRAFRHKPVSQVYGGML
ncbi:hypothetical protein SAMN04488117_10230 [Celeribacter baekdonensis]|uniref:Uncharacterized protein n=1 Tax=Celeribacter baekdonensis TaxID=875171 RepID=A0A1G7HPQ7_9RHOB|nr:hypothetical protein SAMN04488117_10230 [Celeribacter baekdonensis]